MVVNFEGSVPTVALGWKKSLLPPAELADCPAAEIDETLVLPGGHLSSENGTLGGILGCSRLVVLGVLCVFLSVGFASLANITLLAGIGGVSITLAREASPFNTFRRSTRFVNGFPCLLFEVLYFVSALLV